MGFRRVLAGALIIGFLGFPLYSQELAMRLGVRYGSYQRGLLSSLNLHWGPWSTFGNYFFALARADGQPKLNQLSQGVSYNARFWDASAYLFSYGNQGMRLNASLGVRLPRGPQLRFSWFPSDNGGNVSIYHQFSSGVLISATGNAWSRAPFRGQIDISLPVTISLGKKAKPAMAPTQAYAQVREVPTGDLAGVLVAEGEPLPDIVLILEGQRCTTDEEGRFGFRAVRVGNHDIVVVNLPVYYAMPNIRVEVKRGVNTLRLMAEPRR